MTLNQISPSEIANALESALESNGALGRNDLFRATAIIFGGKRLPTSGSAAWVESSLQVAIQRGSVKLIDEKYHRID